MGSRFDEVDLIPTSFVEATVPTFSVAAAETSRRLPLPPAASTATPLAVERPHQRAALWRRCAASLGDISLFAAFGLVLSPLLPPRVNADNPASLLVTAGYAGFLLLVSYYYFTGCWLIWGKTIGGAIFDVKVIADDETPLDASGVSRRWLTLLLTLATGGVGFLPALLPSARSAVDRFSATHSVRA